MLRVPLGQNEVPEIAVTETVGRKGSRPSSLRPGPEMPPCASAAVGGADGLLRADRRSTRVGGSSVRERRSRVGAGCSACGPCAPPLSWLLHAGMDGCRFRGVESRRASRRRHANGGRPGGWAGGVEKTAGVAAEIRQIMNG